MTERKRRTAEYSIPISFETTIWLLYCRWFSQKFKWVGIVNECQCMDDSSSRDD